MQNEGIGGTNTENGSMAFPTSYLQLEIKAIQVIGKKTRGRSTENEK